MNIISEPERKLLYLDTKCGRFIKQNTWITR